MLSCSLREIVCKDRCAYYKPARPEDLACGGYLLLERLAAGNRLPSHDSFRTVPPGLALPLSLILCPECPYYRDDCDFAAEVRGAPPCGGFVTIASLIAQGTLAVDDLCNLL